MDEDLPWFAARAVEAAVKEHGRLLTEEEKDALDYAVWILKKLWERTK